MQSLKDLTLIVSKKKAMLIFFKQENMSIIYLEHMQKTKSFVFLKVVYSWSILHNQQSYKVSTWSDKNTKFSLETV